MCVLRVLSECQMWCRVKVLKSVGLIAHLWSEHEVKSDQLEALLPRHHLHQAITVFSFITNTTLYTTLRQHQPYMASHPFTLLHHTLTHTTAFASCFSR